MTFTEAAIEVLRREGKPLHFRKITEIAVRENLLDHVGKIPEEVMADQVAAHCRLPRPERQLMPVAAGTFALVEWQLDEDPAGLENLLEPPPLDELPYRARERHPIPAREMARVSGRGGDKARRREEGEERRSRRFPPPAEVAYEILASAGGAMSLGEIASHGAERQLMPDAFGRDHAALASALSEDNRRREAAGRRPLFQIDGETVTLVSQPEPGERIAAAASAARQLTPGDLRRAGLAALRRRLRECDPATVEHLVLKLLERLGYREVKVARRGKEHVLDHGPQAAGADRDPARLPRAAQRGRRLAPRRHRDAARPRPLRGADRGRRHRGRGAARRARRRGGGRPAPGAAALRRGAGRGLRRGLARLHPGGGAGGRRRRLRRRGRGGRARGDEPPGPPGRARAARRGPRGTAGAAGASRRRGGTRRAERGGRGLPGGRHRGDGQRGGAGDRARRSPRHARPPRPAPTRPARPTTGERRRRAARKATRRARRPSRPGRADGTPPGADRRRSSGRRGPPPPPSPPPSWWTRAGRAARRRPGEPPGGAGASAQAGAGDGRWRRGQRARSPRRPAGGGTDPAAGGA